MRYVCTGVVRSVLYLGSTRMSTMSAKPSPRAGNAGGVKIRRQAWRLPISATRRRRSFGCRPRQVCKNHWRLLERFLLPHSTRDPISPANKGARARIWPYLYVSSTDSRTEECLHHGEAVEWVSVEWVLVEWVLVEWVSVEWVTQQPSEMGRRVKDVYPEIPSKKGRCCFRCRHDRNIPWS